MSGMSTTSQGRLPPPPEGPPLITLIVKHKVPSLNQLFAMNPWQRKKERYRSQCAVMSALKAGVEDLSTRGETCGEELFFWKTHYDTLAFYLTTMKSSRKESYSKRKSSKKKMNAQ